MKCPWCSGVGYTIVLPGDVTQPCPCCEYADALAREAARCVWRDMEDGVDPPLSDDDLAAIVRRARLAKEGEHGEG